MLMLDRRMLLRAGSAAVGAAALAPTTSALAHAPQAGKRAQPSFYRLKLGTIEITVISDGMLEFPAETLFGDRAEDARGLLTRPAAPRLARARATLPGSSSELMRRPPPLSRSALPVNAAATEIDVRFPRWLSGRRRERCPWAHDRYGYAPGCVAPSAPR